MTTTRTPGSTEARDTAARVLGAEAAAIEGVRAHLDAHFDRAVALVANAGAGGGSLIVSGVGKSGLVGGKLSATFSSLGTASHFMHPTEAVHGDLGRVREGDAALLLSYSGGTEEVVSLAALLRQDGVPIVSITKGAESHLGRLSEAALSVGDIEEACALHLAPTASTAAMLSLGDALAIAVSQARRFTEDDFHRAHRGGALGRSMLPVVEVLRYRVGETMDVLPETASVGDVVAYRPRGELRRPGAMVLVDRGGRVTGVFTDADLRRVLEKRGEGVLGLAVSEVMTHGPRCLGADALVRDAVQLVREMRIDEIPIVDGDRKPLGLLDVQDLIALKVIE